MNQKNSLFFPVLFLIFSALLVSSTFFSLTFPKIPFSFFLPFSLTPLFFGLQKIILNPKKCSDIQILKRSFFYFWSFGFIVQFISFFWVTKPMIYFGFVPPFFAILLFLFICFLSSTFFPLLFSPFVFVLWFKNKYPNKKIFLLPIALSMTLFEIHIPRFFDWSFGTLLSSISVYNQLESLFGFNTGSLFIFYFSLCLCALFTDNFSPRNFPRGLKLKAKKQTFLMCSFVFISVILFGFYRIHHLSQSLLKDPKIRVAFIQPNFTFNTLGSKPLPSKEAQPRNFNTMLEMSEKVIQKSISFDGKTPNLVVWPESTGPDLFLYTPWQIEALKNFSAKTNVPILLQTVELQQNTFNSQHFYNSLLWSSSVVVNKNGLSPYFQKWIPMPFGEEFPLENIFPFIGRAYRFIFKNASKVERGNHSHALPISPQYNVTPFICFDAISQRLPYLSTKEGHSQFFVNQANFVWMADSNAGLELSLIDQMRAIENGKSVVIASNTGPSLAFDPLGRLLLPPTQLLTQNMNFVDIPLSTEKTLFQMTYHWPLDILGFISLCYFSFVFMRRKKY